MAKSMAAILTAAVRRGYDAARRCDGYGSHAYCVPATTRRWPWRRCTTARCATAFLTGGAPTADIIEYPDGTMAFNPTVG